MAGTGKSRRGFASMDPSRQREIASKGGRAAHEKGTAHEWSSDEARVAGQKGGIAVSRDRAHMAAIGREGGESRSRASRQAREQGSASGGSLSSDREMVRSITRDGLLGASNGLGASGSGLSSSSGAGQSASSNSLGSSSVSQPADGR
jgi:general stress protein YciG